MKYKVHAYLRRPNAKVARDLGPIDIEVSGPLQAGAMAKFSYLDKTELGTIDHLERYGQPNKLPTVHIVQSSGE